MSPPEQQINDSLYTEHNTAVFLRSEQHHVAQEKSKVLFFSD